MNFCRFILTVFTCICFFRSEAQEAPAITIPSTPAFSILDFEPTSVLRPANIKAFSSDILSSFDKNGKLLANLGMEVAPYWLKSHNNLTRKNYLNPTFGQTIIRSLTLSAATVRDSASGKNKLGTGLRFKFLNGRPRMDGVDELNALLREKNRITAAMGVARIQVKLNKVSKRDTAIQIIKESLGASAIPDTVIKSVLKQAELIKTEFQDTETSAEDFVEATIVAVDELAKELKEKVSKSLYQRKGLIVEVAGATGFDVTAGHELDKVGIWGNATYILSPNDYMTLTARYISKNNDSSSRNFDLGLGILRENNKFNVSAEAMLRHFSAEIPDINANNQPIIRTQKELTYRIAFQASYKVSDNINVNISFGKGFDSPFITRSAYFSIMGIGYTIFNKEVPEK